MNGTTPEINLNTFPQLNGKTLHLAAIAELKVTLLWSISLKGKEKAADLTLKDLDPRFFSDVQTLQHNRIQISTRNWSFILFIFRSK